MMHAAANSSSVVAARAVATTRGAKDGTRSGVSKIVTRAGTSTSTRATARDEDDDARVGLEGGKAMAAAAFAVSAIVGAVDAAEAYEGKDAKPAYQQTQKKRKSTKVKSSAVRDAPAVRQQAAK